MEYLVDDPRPLAIGFPDTTDEKALTMNGSSFLRVIHGTPDRPM
jgi:hypothetical protein